MPILLSKSLLIACAFFATVESCPRKHIELQKIDCTKANVSAAITITHTLRAGDQSVVTAKLTLTCNGAPVNNAEVSIKIGGRDEQKRNTDASGNASSVFGPSAVNLSGEKVSIVVECTDGPVETTEKIPART